MTSPLDEASALGLPPVDLGARVVWFPVRHHSPACAFHVDRLVRELRPDAVLVEGPRDANDLIPLLTCEDTVAPVAIFSTAAATDGSARSASYYPLCDYSPELVALRAARALGAEARFIDLGLAERTAHPGGGSSRPRSSFEEHRYSHSALLRSACRRTGMRDADELWDHLYEVDGRSRPTAAFIAGVLAYCALARRDATDAELEADGTIARERAMAWEVGRTSGRVVVITGGFHTVALPTTRPAPPAPATRRDSANSLVRYSFDQLDRLNGYASDMPSPAFYQRDWEGRPTAELLVEIARECRAAGAPTSTADALAATRCAQRLATLRGHGRPARADVLDAIRSTYVKGTIEVEGRPILERALRVLAGDRIGRVPERAGRPPILRDFERELAAAGLDRGRVTTGRRDLDLYRRASHRSTSRFFCRLVFLDVPFAERVSGPDFVTGEEQERIHEVWSWRWRPATESSLIERSAWGSTIEEASRALLAERIAESETSGDARRASAGASLLVEACRMGLHDAVAALLPRLSALIAEDGIFTSVVTAAARVTALHVSREPLEAHGLAELPRLAGEAYTRAVCLLPTLASTPDAEEDEVLDGLHALGRIGLAVGDPPEERAAVARSLGDLARGLRTGASIAGMATGLLWSRGTWSGETLIHEVRARLAAPGDFLRGLLRCARPALWRETELLVAIDRTLRGWSDDDFRRHLPGLRLAFASLSPRESERVAHLVAAPETTPTQAPTFEISDADRDLARRVDERLRELL